MNIMFNDKSTISFSVEFFLEIGSTILNYTFDDPVVVYIPSTKRGIHFSNYKMRGANLEPHPPPQQMVQMS